MKGGLFLRENSFLFTVFTKFRPVAHIEHDKHFGGGYGRKARAVAHMDPKAQSLS